MPSSVPFGGAERRFAYLFSYLSKKNPCSVYLITNQAAFDGLSKLIDGFGDYESNVFTISDSKGHSLISKLFKLRQMIFFFKSLLFLKSMKITHVHFPVNPSGYAFALSFFLSFMNISMSCSVVNSIKRSKSDFSRIQYLLWKRVIKKSLWIDFLSPSIATNMKAIFGFIIKDKRSSISPCSFSYSADLKFSLQEDFSEIEAKKKIDVLFLSRFISGKGVEVLLHALKILEDQRIKMRVTIAGFGELEGYIQDSIKNFSYVDCEICFSLNPMSLLEVSRLVLSIQQYENYPSQTILEAASCFATIIATNVGDTPMICNSKNSVLIDYDPLSLANAIVALLGNTKLRRELSSTLYSDVKQKHSVEVFSNYFTDRCASLRPLEN